MNCVSCSADVPAKWLKCYEKNECPSCGGPIMDEHSKELLDGLTQALQEMPNNPLGLAGWLLSHYHLEKYGTGEPEQFHEGKKPKRRQVNEDGEMEENKFFKRAEVPNKLKDLAKQITSASNNMYGGDDEKEFINESASDEPTEEDYEIAKKMMPFAPPTKKANAFQKSLKSFLPEQQEVNSEDLKIAQSFVTDPTDPVLEKDRMERLKMQELRVAQKGGPAFKRV